MKKFKILVLLLISLISCKQEKAKKVQKKTTKSTQKANKPKRKADTKVYPNTKTAVAFFEEYGKKNPETKGYIETKFGNIYFELFEDTPLHRASFIYLVKEGYFDLTCFHRVVPDFIVQGGNGDTEAVANFKNKRKNYRIPPEFKSNHPHGRGTLAAAREWEYNPKKLTTPFEFYIILGVDDYGHLDGEHTVFGKITKGMDVVDTISMLPTSRDEWPMEDVNIKIKLLP